MKSANLLSKIVGINSNFYTFLHVHNTQKLSLMKPVMLIQVLWKYELNLPYHTLSTCFKRSQIHLPTVKHLFSSRHCDSSLGSSLLYSKLAVLFHSHYPLHLSCLACCRMHFFSGSFVSSNLSQLSIYSYEYTPFRIIKQNFSSQPR